MGGAAIAALAMIAYAFFRPAVDPAEEERKRRLHLNQIGRIAEGHVVTLLCSSACTDASHCHRTLLRELIEAEVAALGIAPKIEAV